jgi:cyclohexa-1,5-dienecarbonyl-CoA hydratase
MPLTVALSSDQSRAALVFAGGKGNLITRDLVGQLRQALVDLAGSPHLKLVTLEGAGADFSFGASVPEHVPEQIAHVLPEFHALISDLMYLPMPTAAIVRGRCLGGGFELALACDFILAGDDATLGLPEIALGVFPPVGSVLLPKRVGAAAATSAVLTGVSRSAQDWQRLGLIELVAAASALGSDIDAWFARALGTRSAAALRHAVAAMRGPLAQAVSRELPEAERLYLGELMSTSDAVEGIRAFMEKRAPRWRDC